MERHYIFFRCWEHFSAGFPFEKLDDYSDDKINGELEAYAVSWGRNHKKRLRTTTHKKAGRLAVALEKRAKKGTVRSDVHYRTRRSNKPTKLFEPPRHFSPGCRIAYEVGWLQKMLPGFGGSSPSKRLFFMQVEGEEIARAVVEHVTEQWPAIEKELVENEQATCAHLGIRFGCVPASKLDSARQGAAEAAIEDVTENKRGDFIEWLQHLAAAEGLKLEQKMLNILKREAEQSGTPAEATPAVATGTTENKATATKPPRDVAAEDAPDPPLTLADIPEFDKDNGEWVDQKEAAKIVNGETGTLKKERHHGLKAIGGLSGISTRKHFWTKESINTKTVMYHKPSLSPKTIPA